MSGHEDGRVARWPGGRMKVKHAKAEGRKRRLQTADGGWKDGRKDSEWWRDTGRNEGADRGRNGAGRDEMRDGRWKNG